MNILHLAVVDEAYKLPASKMNEALWHITGKMQYCNLLVVGCAAFISEQRVLHDPRLAKRNLRALILYYGWVGLVNVDLGFVEVQLQLVGVKVFEEYRAIDVIRCY